MNKIQLKIFLVQGPALQSCKQRTMFFVIAPQYKSHAEGDAPRCLQPCAKHI